MKPCRRNKHVLNGGKRLSLVSSFQPVIDEHARILILGSIPSVESLQKQQYYANPRNQFWRMIYAIFDAELGLTYEEKISFIKQKKIGLWDVIEQCYREGSLDTSIRDERVNHFRDLYQAYPNTKTVMFNGSKAYETYKKFVGFDVTPELTFYRLTSSSPANTQRLEDKLKEWRIIKELLSDESLERL